jgi:hypothetical protein
VDLVDPAERVELAAPSVTVGTAVRVHWAELGSAASAVLVEAVEPERMAVPLSRAAASAAMAALEYCSMRITLFTTSFS